MHTEPEGDLALSLPGYILPTCSSSKAGNNSHVFVFGSLWQLNGCLIFTPLPMLPILFYLTLHAMRNMLTINDDREQNKDREQNIHTGCEYADQLLCFHSLPWLKVFQILLSWNESPTKNINHLVCHHVEAIRITYTQWWLSSCLFHIPCDD